MEHLAHQDTRCHRLVDAFREENGAPISVHATFNENKLALCKSSKATKFLPPVKIDFLSVSNRVMCR
jgi:hypothetical protein